MPAMRLPRPKSLSGLMLIGFTIVAAPLLFAIVNAAVQMNRLSNRSEQLVVHGMQGTRHNQRLFEEIGALERTARLYQIIPSTELLEVYARNQQRFVSTIEELLTLPLDGQSQLDAHALRSDADRIQLLEVYARNQQRFVSTIEELLTLPLDGQSQLDAHALRSDADRLWADLKSAEPTSPRLAGLLTPDPQV